MPQQLCRPAEVRPRRSRSGCDPLKNLPACTRVTAPTPARIHTAPAGYLPPLTFLHLQDSTHMQTGFLNLTLLLLVPASPAIT